MQILSISDHHAAITCGQVFALLEAEHSEVTVGAGVHSPHRLVTISALVLSDMFFRTDMLGEGLIEGSHHASFDPS